MSQSNGTGGIQLIPILGGLPNDGTTSDHTSSCCYILRIDGATILLDIGCSSQLDCSSLEPLQKFISTIDAVLLSHGTLRNCGGLPYVMQRLNLRCPVYATFPVQTMGRLATLSALKSHFLTSRSLALTSFPSQPINIVDPPFTRRDVDLSFNHVTLLRYSQPLMLSGKAQGIVVTAFAAGHSVGGTVWKISSSSDDVVYSMDINHRLDSHLSPTQLFADGNQVLPALIRPSLLVAGCQIPSGIGRVRDRDANLITPIVETLKEGGNVMIPMEPTGRLLEIVQIMEELWHTRKLAYPVVVLSPVAPRVIHSARGMLEWYNDSLTKLFSSRRMHPFDLKYVKLAKSWTDLRKYPDPKVIICSDGNLGYLFSRPIIASSSNNPKHLVIIPSAASPLGYLTRALVDIASQSASGRKGDIVVIEQMVTSHAPILAPLTESERLEYDSALLREEALADKKSTDLQDELDDNNGNDNGDESMTPHLDIQNHVHAGDHGPLDLAKKRPTVTQFIGYDAYVRNSPVARFPMTLESWRHFDEYGEIVKPSSFMTDADRVECERTGAARKREATVALNGESFSDEEEEVEVEIISGITNQSSMDSSEILDTQDTFKLTWQPSTINVNTRVKLIDMDGLADADALVHILPMVQARSIALVGGDLVSTCMVRDRLRSALISSIPGGVDRLAATGQSAIPEIYTPQNGDLVSPPITRGVTVQVKLTDALFTRVKMVRYGDHDIGALSAAVQALPSTALVPALNTVSLENKNPGIDATLVPISSSNSLTEAETERSMQPNSTNTRDSVEAIPVLDILDAVHAVRPPSVVLGSLRLADFKNVLDESGLQTEFISGVLVVENKVGVFKTINGDITIEGGICPEYYKIRQLLYAQHVTF